LAIANCGLSNQVDWGFQPLFNPQSAIRNPQLIGPQSVIATPQSNFMPAHAIAASNMTMPGDG
jgi:hypothetical protein